MHTVAELMQRHQVSLYLLALASGAILGLGVPSVSGPAQVAIIPVLGLLLYATFLGVPFARIGQGLRDWRFIVTVLVVNFVCVPVVVWMLSRAVAADPVLLVGVLFVLLAPCVDYVIVFTGLAGGAVGRLLATTPLLMGAQIVLLPIYLWSLAGAEVMSPVDLAPFVEAFLLLIVLPLLTAGLTQWVAARTRWGAVIRTHVTGAMVPIMMLTLAVVVASQIAAVSMRLGSLVTVVPIYILFAVTTLAVGLVAGRIARLDVAGRRAAVFSGVTRNSLVVLPLVLALPASFDLAPLVVVTQTLVELLVMVVFVRLVPLLVPDPFADTRPRSCP